MSVSRRDFFAAGAAVAALGRKADALYSPTLTSAPLVIDCQSHLYFPEILARMEKRTEDPVVLTGECER